MSSIKPTRPDDPEGTSRDSTLRLPGDPQTWLDLDFASQLRLCALFARTHLQGLGFGLVLLSSDLNRFLYIGSTAQQLVGCSQAELDKDPMAWLQNVEEADREKIGEAMESARRGGPAHASYRLRYEGQVRWLHSRFSCITDPRQHSHLLITFEDTTDRNLATKAALESERRFRTLAVNSTVGIFHCDLDGNSLFVNDSFCAIAGLTPAAAQGPGWQSTLHPLDGPIVRSQWREAIAGKTEFAREFRYLHNDGTTRWVWCSAVPFRDESGRIATYLGNLLDITQRKQVEDSLRESEQRFRLLSNCSPMGIFLSDNSGQIIYANPQWQSIVGCQQHELMGLGFLQFMHPDDRDAAIASWAGAATSTGPHDVERRVVSCSGQTRWTHVRSSPLLAPDGNVLGRVGTVEDITDRRSAEEQLRSSEARMRGILDTAADGIVTFNDAGIIELYNAGAERLFGYRADEVLGTNMRRLARRAAVKRAKTLPRNNTGFRDRTARETEYVCRRKDGTVCEFEARVGATVIDGHRIYTAILHDIAARKRTERMLRETEKLAATGRIAARIAHEINNPLAGIKNSFLLVKDAIPECHPYFSYVGRIENEVNRIARIVRQMFDLYRPDPLMQRQIELAQAIHDVAAMLESIAKARDVSLAVDTHGIDRPLWLPDDAVWQVLYNVIVNAIEASPSGGIVRIAASLSPHQAEIQIIDQGLGIEERLRSLIYEPFFTTKSQRDTGGLGLGLSISRGIVEAMRGVLDFECPDQGGTVFHIRLPMAST